jgi:hypothetical protein
LITQKILQRPRRLLVRTASIKLQELRRVNPKFLFRRGLQLCTHGFRFPVDRQTTFIAIPSSQQRNIILLPRRKNRWNRLGKKISIDIRGEVKSLSAFFLGGHLQQLLSRHCAQFGERLRTHRRRDYFCVLLFPLSQALER